VELPAQPSAHLIEKIAEARTLEPDSSRFDANPGAVWAMSTITVTELCGRHKAEKSLEMAVERCWPLPGFPSANLVPAITDLLQNHVPHILKEENRAECVFFMEALDRYTQNPQKAAALFNDWMSCAQLFSPS
jgi:hypothetical protein